MGHVTAADVNIEHRIELVSALAGAEHIPKPGDPKYAEAKEVATKFLIEELWTEGQVKQWGIEVTDQNVSKELKKIKKESFKSTAEFRKFLREPHPTYGDAKDRVKSQILNEKILEHLREGVPKPSLDDVTAYYEAARSTQFTQEANRDVRQILNKDREKAGKSRELLEEDNSSKSWRKVAKELSEDPSTKGTGGLRQGVTEAEAKESLGPIAFSVPEDKFEGPVKTSDGYFVFEITGSTPKRVQSLKEVEGQIKSTLAQRIEQEYIQNYFGTRFTPEWTNRTVCASGYVISLCANYKGNGHPREADPACYEANPKKPTTECPAPVIQAKPALPGSVTPLKPDGEPLAQRPIPPGEATESSGA